MRKERAGALQADLALLGITAIWGFTFPAVQNALRDVDPLTFVAIRFSLASVALFLALRGRALRTTRSGLAYGVALGVCLGAGSLLQTMGLNYTTAPRSAFITALYVVITPLLALLLARVRPRASTLAAILFATAGLYLITEPGVSGINLGDWFTLACSFAFGLHILIAERAVARHSPLAMTFWQVLTAGLISCLALGVQGHVRFVASPWSLTALGVTAFLATAVAFGIQMWAQRRTTATHAAIIFAAEPVFAALFSFVIQGEVMGPEAFLGGLLILGAILLIQMGTARKVGEEMVTTATAFRQD